MRKSPVYKYVVTIILIANLLCLNARAQEYFHFKATLDSIPQSGFYTVHLPPIVTAECQPQLEDIRIKEGSNEVPYILKQQTTTSADSLMLLPLLKTGNDTKVTLQNKNGTGTNELVLFIKNTAATRAVTLSGSDDTSHWFIIKEGIELAKNNNDNDESFFNQIIQFPYSKYRYFQLSMPGKNVLPLNIFKAGIYSKATTVNNNYDTLPKPAIVQHDSSDKRSYIQLLFDKNYRIDQIRLSLSGAKFFNRSSLLFDGKSTDGNMLATGNLTSRDSSIKLNLQAKTKALLLVINNFDNTPLKVNTLAAYQLPVELIAYLDAGKHYNLFFGNATLQAPAYDLQYFKDSISNSTRILTIKKIEKIAVPADVTAASKSHLNTWLLWSIIIAVLLLLIYFSYTLLRDINRKTTNTDAHL